MFLHISVQQEGIYGLLNNIYAIDLSELFHDIIYSCGVLFDIPMTGSSLVKLGMADFCLYALV